MNKRIETKKRKLDFGSGFEGSKDDYGTKLKGYETADLYGADHNFDFNKFPYPFKDNTFDEIVSRGVIDHLDDFYPVMNELHRISKHNAIVKISGPFYNCANSYLPSHKQHLTFMHFFSLTKDKVHNTPEQRILQNEHSYYEIIKFKTRPGLFGKFIPDIKITKYLGLRYFIGMLLGDVVVNIRAELRVIKGKKKKIV